MKRVFIDTNVFIDFIARRGDFYRPAATIVSLARNQKIELCVSALSFATGSYLLERHYGMTRSQILADYQLFITLCGVTTVDADTVNRAVGSSFDDFEDAIQHYSALLDGVDCIVTRNKADFEESDIPVLEPQEFLDSLR